MTAFSCSICSEKLHKFPGEEQSRSQQHALISSIPCGHIFHTYCIQKWLSGNLGTNKQCPCCRMEVPGLRCLPLFPSTCDSHDSVLDESLPEICGAHEGTLSHLKDQLSKVKTEKKDLETRNQLLKATSDFLNEMLAKEKCRSNFWKNLSKESVQQSENKSKQYALERQALHDEFKKNFKVLLRANKHLKEEFDSKVKELKKLQDFVKISQLNGANASPTVPPNPGPSTAIPSAGTLESNSRTVPSKKMRFAIPNS